MQTASQPDSVSTRLASMIRKAIAANGGWLPFDRFMAMALYAPGLGYYANASAKFGAMPASGSDFVTAPEMSPLFGRALAVQVAQALTESGTRTVLEFGAGTGALAEQLLDALALLGHAEVDYRIIDLSGELRLRQRARLARHGDRVQWLDALPDQIEGVVVGNEVLDAMPVQLLQFDGARWLERGVVVSEAGFGWQDRPTDLRPPIDQGFVPDTLTEIHPQARAWTDTLVRRLVRGVAILIDYGFPEAEYYLPQRRTGTLMCHRAHLSDTDPLADVGLKDITAHVDFTGIALAAQDAGAEVLGYTSQGRFLINCGIAPMMQAASLREQIMSQRLITEHEMGELFKVIVFTRGCSFDAVGFTAGDRSHRL